MMRIALYARVSSSQQAQEATIDSQVEALRERAESDGHVVLPTDVYVDDGYSGASLVRPGLERLRDRAAEGAVELLYVHCPDRLARRYAYQVLLLDEFARHGVTVTFLHGPSGRSAEDELLVQVQGMIAEYERAKILERCRRGKKHRARTGLVNPRSGAPYGYEYMRKTDLEPAQYQVLLHEARVVRSIFSWFVDEQLSIGAIVRRLAEQGIETRTGKARWDRTTVWGLLKNPAYSGRAAFGKTEAVPRGRVLRQLRGRGAPRRAKSSQRDRPEEDWIYVPVPALVSREVFEAAQEQLARNRRLSKRNGRGERYLLQGLTVCAKCRYAYYGKTVTHSAARGGRRYAYYRCTGTDGYRFEGGRVCDNKQIRTDQLDDYVWQSVRQVLEDPERVLEEWSRRSDEDSTVAALRDLRDEARRHLTGQQRILQRLVDAYEAGAIDLPDLKARSERVRTRIREAERQLDKAQASLDETVELREVVATLTHFAEQVRSSLAEATWTLRQRLIRTLVTRVEIDDEGATVVFRVPPATGGAGRPGGDDGAVGDGGERPSDESCRLRWGRAVAAPEQHRAGRARPRAGPARAPLHALRRRCRHLRAEQASRRAGHGERDPVHRGPHAAEGEHEEERREAP